MARLVIIAQNKVSQSIASDQFLAIYKREDGSLFTGNKGYESVVKAIRANDSAVGAIKVEEWLEIAKSGGVDAIDDALESYVG